MIMILINQDLLPLQITVVFGFFFRNRIIFGGSYVTTS